MIENICMFINLIYILVGTSVYLFGKFIVFFHLIVIRKIVFDTPMHYLLLQGLQEVQSIARLKLPHAKNRNDFSNSCVPVGKIDIEI